MEHSPEAQAIKQHADDACAAIDAIMRAWRVDDPAHLYTRDFMLGQLGRIDERVKHALANVPLT